MKGNIFFALISLPVLFTMADAECSTNNQGDECTFPQPRPCDGRCPCGQDGYCLPPKQINGPPKQQRKR